MAKLNWFQDQYRGQSLAADASALRVHLCALMGKHVGTEHDLRNGVLYHERGSKPPWLRFRAADFANTYKRVRQFVLQNEPLL